MKNNITWKTRDILLLLLFAFGINILISFFSNGFFQAYPFLGYLLQSTIFAVSIWYCIKCRNPETKWIDIGFRRIGTLKTIGISISAWIICIGTLALLMSYFGDIPGLQQQESHLDIFGNTIMAKIGFAFLAILIAPIFEEIIFRGILLKWSLLYIHPGIAILLNGILFGVLHLEFQSLISLAVIGVVLAATTYYSKSIIPAIVFHIINNSIAVVVELFLI